MVSLAGPLETELQAQENPQPSVCMIATLWMAFLIGCDYEF